MARISEFSITWKFFDLYILCRVNKWYCSLTTEIMKFVRAKTKRQDRF
jgi:hypothetical protein